MIRPQISLIAALTCAAAFAQQLPSLRVAGQIGGPAIAVASAERMVVSAAGYRLTIHDDSDPNVLRELGSATFSDFVRGIALAGGKAYVAAGSSGLHVVDLADPNNPSIVGTWDSPGSAEAVAVAGTNAYLADGPFGLRVIDVSNAASPRPLGAAFDDSFAFDVALSGTTAIVAAGTAGVLLAGVSDPQSPIELATIDTPGSARGVAIIGTRIAVADQWEGLRLFDMTTRLEIASLQAKSWAMDVAISGTNAFVATGSAGLTVVDLAAPKVIGSLDVPNGDSVAISTSANRAFLAAGRAGTLVLDVATAASPRLVHTVPAIGDVLGVAAAPPHVFVAGGGGFTAVDATIPSRPRQGNSVVASASEFGTYVATSSGYAYLGVNGQLVTFDVTDPMRPVETSRVDAGPAAFRGMAIRDTLLLAATEWDLSIYDITQKSAPVLRGRLPMYTGPGTQQAVGVATTGRYAFVAHDKDGMAVVDLLNPSAPVIVTHYGADPVSGVASIAAAGNYAYVPNCGRLEVVNIANPANPIGVAQLAFSGCPYRATLAGQTLYLAMGSGGVFEIDVANPFNPRMVSQTVLPGSVQEIAVGDSWIAVAVLKLGLFLLQKPGATSTTISHSSPVERWALSPPAKRRTESAPLHLPMKPTARQIVVNSTADSGAGSLREATAFATIGDVITFDPSVFPPAAPVAIRPLSAYGCVRNVTIDASNAGVVLDGSMIAEGQPTAALQLCSTGAVIKGLKILNFPGSGIAVGGTGNTIEGNLVTGNRNSGIDLGGDSRRNRIVGNLIGVPLAGFALRYPQAVGLFFARGEENTAEGNVIGGNHIDVGFIVASHNAVINNYIGTDVTGTRVAANQLASSSEIGVNLEGGSHDNLISGNVIASGQAVAMADSGTHYNRIVNNRIGIGPDGARIAGEVSSLGSGIGVGEAYNLVAGNVIGGIRTAAIHVSAPLEVHVIGNRVGMDPSGTTSIPNATSGGSIVLQGTRRTFVEHNIVSGNNGSGVELRGSSTEQNFILGNTLGATVFGAPLGNGGAGIRIESAQNNFIQRNRVTANPAGIQSTNDSLTRIRRNEIFGNARAGIEHLMAQAPAAPVITETGLDFVRGSACVGCLVEVFSATDDEGRWFEGEAVAGSDGRFTMRRTNGFLRGPRVSATATDTRGATSVFSATVATPPRPLRRRVVRP